MNCRVPAPIAAGDAALVARARRGDAASFEAMLRRYRGDVAAQLLRVVDPVTAEELLHEVAIRAFLGLPSLRRTDRIRPWLTRIAHCVAVDWIRDRVGRRNDPDVDPMTLAADVPDHDRRPPDEHELPRIVARIARLRPRPATVLLLRGLEGKSYREIAGLLSMSLPSVKTDLYRARRTLRDQLARRCGGLDPHAGGRTTRKER